MRNATRFQSRGGQIKDEMSDRGAGEAGATPPGDKPEAHEDNTFGLPDGTPIKKVLRKWFSRIAKEVLGDTPTIGAPIPDYFPALADYTDPMASAMAPILSAYWDEAGQVTRAKLGLDPADWRVVDPHLHEAIQTQAHNLCESTLATTSDMVGTVYQKLREELTAGLLTEGESIPQLTKRVRSIFTDLSKNHAELIARTEASRAVHTASEMSAKASGVVTGKVWLLSTNACPLCHSLANASNAHPIPLGGEFANIGNNETYASIRMPPGHPRCRCSVTYRLTDEYEALLAEHGPKYDTFQAGALGLELKKREIAPPAPKPVEPKPIVVSQPNPVVHPTPAPVLPPPVIVVPVEPAKPTEPKPKGKPVADALNVKAKGETGKNVRDAIDLIGKVHGDGTLPVIPIEETKKGTAFGLFRRTPDNQPIDIQIHKSGTDQKFTTVHEIGHFLEKSAIGGTVTKNGGRDWVNDPVFKDWHAAVMKSESVRQIQETASKDTVLYRNPYTGKDEKAKVPKATANYLLMPEELWARSYAQYIAHKSKDPEMLAVVAHDVEHSSEAKMKMCPQWWKSDFHGIEAEIDKIMVKQGWRS